MDSDVCGQKNAMSKVYQKSTNTNNADAEYVSTDEYSCGIFGFRPKSLNKFNNILTFSVILGIVGVLASVQTYFSSQIPHLEKQFGLNSAETGFIYSWSRIGYLIFNLFGSSIAQLVHIPLFLFWSIFIYSIAGLCLSLPYFVIAFTGQIGPATITPKEMNNSTQGISSNQTIFNNVNQYFCELNNLTNIDNSECSKQLQTEETNGGEYQFKTMATVVFSICLFVSGLMYASRFPFGVVFIDDNVDKAKTGFYVGLVNGIGIFGPAIAFAIGGVTSKIYVTLEDVDFTYTDPRWIGAWWMGFIVFSVGTIVTAMPMLCFSRKLKERKKEEKIELQKSQDSNSEPIDSKERFKERALSYWRVLTTPIYVFLIVVNCITGFPWVGYWSFISKYITTQFGTPLWKGNMILAVSNIVSLCAGCFGGGIISRKIKMTPRNCVLINASFTFISIIIFAFGLVTGCDQPEVVGPSQWDRSEINSSSSCVSDCSCDENKYFPVCGSNGVTYHSPCYAGCPITYEKNAIFFNCTCVTDGKATAGLCPSDCPNLYPWAVINFFSFFIDALTWMPMVTAWLRTVEDRDKSTAIGLQTIVGTLLSYIPAPIAYGKLIDTTCLIWESTCGVKGSCQLYNIVDLRVKLYAVTVGMKLFGVLGMFYLLWKVWKVEAWEHFRENRRKEMKTLCN